MSLSASQRATLVRVARAGTWQRATSSGERVTLASLARRGLLERRAWRGQLGEPDAAHEYRLSPAAAAVLERERDRAAFARMDERLGIRARRS